MICAYVHTHTMLECMHSSPYDMRMYTHTHTHTHTHMITGAHAQGANGTHFHTLARLCRRMPRASQVERERGGVGKKERERARERERSSTCMYESFLGRIHFPWRTNMSFWHFENLCVCVRECVSILCSTLIFWICFLQRRPCPQHSRRHKFLKVGVLVYSQYKGAINSAFWDFLPTQHPYASHRRKHKFSKGSSLVYLLQ